MSIERYELTYAQWNQIKNLFPRIVQIDQQKTIASCSMPFYGLLEVAPHGESVKTWTTFFDYLKQR